jgi:hypothetical protein
MKVLKILFSTFVIIMSFVHSSFSQRTCGSHQLYQNSNQNPEINKERQKLERFTEQLINSETSNRSSTVYTIKVAVHVVMSNPALVSNSQIASQISVLTQDFRKLNPGVTSVPSAFQNLISDTEFEFVLANVGPDCNGITRTVNATNCFDYESTDMKSTAAGGHDPIDAEHILNIWVTPICDGILGFATFPGEPLVTDGVVIDPSAFGTSGTAQAPYNLGRTATHELGHYFNLIHIWGDELLCTGTDNCADTPNQASQHYGCPTFPQITCSNSPFGDMFMNYMDFVDDNCMHMFTPNQSTRMLAALLNSRPGLIGSSFAEVCCAIKNLLPTVSGSFVSNSCGTNSINLNQYHTGQIPAGATLVWSTDNNPNDGVSPILTGTVNSSGTYFAYFYNEAGNCFSSPSLNSIVVTIIDKTEKPDINISLNTYTTGTNFYGGNIIVNNGASLHIHLANITFFENKGIIVRNGGQLILQGSTIDVCQPTQSWAGIKIESGGFFDTDDTFLKNAANGAEAYANSTLQINNLNIDGKGNTSGIGLKLDGNVNSDFIYNLDIKDFNIGIQSFTSSKVHEFNHGSITNTTTGISTVSSSIVVNDYNINFTKEAITLTGSGGSSIFESDIIYKESGITLIASPSTIVENCSISNNDVVNGIEYLNERPAIAIGLSDNCVIKNNYPISSLTNAVYAWGSNNATIDNNTISTNATSNSFLPGGPVNLQFGNGHIVTQNNITSDQSEFGINSTWAGNTTIMNNDITASGFVKNVRTSAIKATGNLNEMIEQNIVTGDQRAGVIVQNTMGNKYICNEVNSIFDEAQDILYNSEQQTFKANTFGGGSFDMKIKSEIGTQATLNSSGNAIENNGNIFLGGNAQADPAVVFQSTFPFNPINPNHKPANPNPSSGWFTQNNVGPFANCDGLIIGNNFIFGNDPTKICAYWNYLKSIRTTKPELFFIKLVHLLKYAKTRQGFTLPNCIKFDPVFQSLCGVTKIVDISVALTKLSGSNINVAQMKALQTQYSNENSDAGKKAIKNQMSTEMAVLKPQYDVERNADSIRLDSIKTELNTINCTSIIVNKWKEILKIYVNFVKQGTVANTDKAALESYSTNCSDLYGEAIHLARAMANTYNRIYYDVNDGCLEEQSTPRQTTPVEEISVNVSPNPTSGLVNVSFSSGYSGTISVFDISGRLIHTLDVNKAYGSTIDLSDKQAGLYFFQVTSDSGNTKEFKIILIK